MRVWHAVVLVAALLACLSPSPADAFFWGRRRNLRVGRGWRPKYPWNRWHRLPPFRRMTRQQATCEKTVSFESSNTEESAVQDFASMMVELQEFYCRGVADPEKMSSQAFDGYIEATADLMLTSHIKCDARGQRSLACESTFVEARAFAQASFDVYREAIAKSAVNSECTCGQRLFADADAAVSAWATIWSDIYATLEDTACVSGTKRDEIPSRVDRTVVKTCTSTVIASYWGKVVAEAWLENDCRTVDPVECATCCVDAEGATIPECECEAWTAECQEAATARTTATAQAWVNTEVEQSTASCTTTVHEKVKNTVREVPVTDPSKYGTFENNSGANVSAPVSVECNAESEVTANAQAVNAQAVASASFLEETCSLALDSKPLAQNVDGVAKAIADVYTVAYAKCAINGTSDDNNGGCALSQTFGAALASSCAEATAEAVASISTQACECDLSAALSVEAWTREYTQLFAKVEQEVEAFACTDADKAQRSEIRRRCIINSVATTVAKVLADVSLQNGCVRADSAWCRDSCAAEHDSETEAFEGCTSNCGGRVELFIEALVDNLASISTTTDYSCLTEDDPIGVIYFSEVSQGPPGSGTADEMSSNEM